jgi:hypothetical protein
MAVRPVKASSASAGSGGITFVGEWNAATNTPDLNTIPANNGDYYVVTVAGNTIIDGNSVWHVNDWAVFNGAVWYKINNSTGAVATADFSGAGKPVPATFVGQVYFNHSGAEQTITNVCVWQQTSGIGGNLVVDILVNSGSGWNSIWSVNPANRPTLSYLSGDDSHISGATIDSPSVPVDAKIRMDIISSQSGFPENILVQVTF